MTATDGKRYAFCSREEYKKRAKRYAEDANAWVHPLDEPRIVAEYDYKDEHGKLLFQVVRYEPKAIRQRRPDGRRGWIWNIKDTRLVLYLLPELTKADPQATVYIPEGEKDVDNLRARGLVATCNAMGAGKWRDEYNESLRGRHVAILPDNDKAGADHARQVSNALFGVAASVKIVELPGLPEKGDVSDWIAAGGTAAQLAEIADGTPILDSRLPIGSEEPNRVFSFTALSDLLTEPEEETAYIWDRVLPASGLSILAAKPKVGKSTLARNLAVAVARGEPFFGRDTARGAVLYLALEEKRAEIAAHFRRMGAASESILVFAGAAPEDALDALTVAINEYSPALVIVDPLQRLVRLTDINEYAQVSNAMEPLVALARSSGAHILALHHLGKGDRAEGDAVLGSTALFASVDALLTMRQKNDHRSLSSIQRYGENLHETIVVLDPETGITTPGGNMATVRLAEAKRAVMEHLGNEELTEPDIKERVGGDQTLTAKALRALLIDTQIDRVGAGKRNDPYKYRVAPSWIVPAAA